MSGQMIERTRAFIERYPIVWFIVIPFIAAVIFVNPLRYGFRYDDWAYARLAENLLRTFQYRPDDYIAASGIPQVYLGALFLRVFGPSHGNLYLSTILFMLSGIIAFYSLALDYGFDRLQASFLALCLFISPLIFNLTFSFDTEMPSLALVLIALALYTRGLKRKSYPVIFLASIAASAAILSRQTLAILPVAVGLSWLIRANRKEYFLLYVLAMVPPIIAAAWLAFIWTDQSTWVMQRAAYEQSLYLSRIADHPLWHMFQDTLPKTIIILHYLVYFSLPLFPLMVFDIISQVMAWWRGRTSGRKLLITLAIPAAIIAAGMSQFQHVVHIAGSWVMPFIPWIVTFNPKLAVIVTIVTTIGSVLLLRIILLRYFDTQEREAIQPIDFLIDFYGVLSLLVMLFFFAMGDRYLTLLVPCALIVAGKHLQKAISLDFESEFAIALGGLSVAVIVLLADPIGIGSPGGFGIAEIAATGIGFIVFAAATMQFLQRYQWTIRNIDFSKPARSFVFACLCAAVLLGYDAVLTRSDLSAMEARWHEGDALLRSGVDPRELRGTTNWIWQSYRLGLFDEYAATYSPTVDGFDYFWKWLAEPLSTP
jgi:hypothetical protein